MADQGTTGAVRRRQVRIDDEGIGKGNGADGDGPPTDEPVLNRTASATEAAVRKAMSRMGRSTLITETETNRSITMAMLVFDGELNYDAYVDCLQAILPRFPRLTSKVVNETHFEQVPNFQARTCVDFTRLPSPGTDAILRRIVSEYSNEPLDMSLPLWRHHVFTGLEGGRSAVLLRSHHCIGDGTSGGLLLTEMFDGDLDMRKLAMEAYRKSHPRTSHETKAWHVRLFHRSAAALQMALAILFYYVVGTLMVGFKLFLALFWKEPVTMLKPAELTGTKEVAFSTGPRVAAIKAGLKKIPTSGRPTVNDAVLSAVAFALRTALLETGTDAPGLHIGVPVDIRDPRARTVKFGNHFGFILAAIPTDQESLSDRLQATCKTMSRIKYTPEAKFAYTTAVSGSFLPLSIHKAMGDWSIKHLSAVCTNVRLAPIPVTLAGVPLAEGYVFVPPPPGVAIGFAICSFNGNTFYTVNVDSAIGVAANDLLEAVISEMTAIASAGSTG